MTTDTTLSLVPAVAADYIRKHGWAQHTMSNPGGSTCLHGAIRARTPHLGDAEIVRVLARHQGYTETWNDMPGRTESDVLDALTHVDTSDEAIARVFGPQWKAIVALIRRAVTLTDQEVEALRASLKLTVAAALHAARRATWRTNRGAAWAGAEGTACGGVRAAAVALVARDLIGQNGFTQEHYDTLTRPWATVIGPAHPDDKKA